MGAGLGLSGEVNRIGASISALIRSSAAAAACQMPDTLARRRIGSKDKPIEVKKLEIEMTINLKVDKQLDDFFDFEDEFEEGGE